MRCSVSDGGFQHGEEWLVGNLDREACGIVCNSLLEKEVEREIMALYELLSLDLELTVLCNLNMHPSLYRNGRLLSHVSFAKPGMGR